MAERISVFGIVVGIALLLAGLGFGILALGGALRPRPAHALEHATGAVPAPAGASPPTA